MSYLAGLSVETLLSHPSMEEEQLFINPHAIKPPTAEREAEIRDILQVDNKQRHQFVDGGSWVDFLMSKLKTADQKDYFWPMTVVVDIVNVRALQHMGYISEKEMDQYIGH